MVAPVYITKIKVKGSIIYYHVQAPQDKQEFWIGIDKLKKELMFFCTNSFVDPIKIIDLSGNDVYFCEVPGIKSTVANFVVARAYAATLKNEFPQNINYNFH